MGSPFPGPTPPFNNPPIHPEYYVPKRFEIENVQLGQMTTVTTTVDMDYVIGQEVRLLIPNRFGCIQLNEVTGIVLIIPASNQVTINIDSSRNVDPFVLASSPNRPQIIPIGDINTGAINNSGRVNNITYIPGSFINIS